MPGQEVLKDLARRFENGTIEFLEENSEFVVGCDQCGECCRNRDDILLSPYDVFHMVKATGMQIVDMLKKYTETYLGPTSNLPIIRVVYRKEQDGSTTCPFLGKKSDKYYCRIHENKPYVCRSYPLGRMTSYSSEEITDANNVKPGYFQQPIEGTLCSGMKRAICNNSKHTVCEWVGGKEKKEKADRYWALYIAFTKKMSNTIKLKEVYNLQNEELKSACFNMMFNLLYLEYDFEADEDAFLAKYEANTNKILEYLKILAMYPNGKLKPKKNKNANNQ